MGRKTTSGIMLTLLLMLMPLISEVQTQDISYDLAVTDVTPSKTVVGQGYSVSINVTVENQGDYTETFNVTAYYGNATITPEQWETFWSLGDVNRDGYIDDTDAALLLAAFGLIGYSWADLNQDGVVNLIDAGILVTNAGLNIWAYFISGAPIGTQTVVDLPSGTSTTLTFTWTTTGIAKGSYTISAYATPIYDVEIDRADNNYGDGNVLVTVAGDINGDGIVNVFDLYDLGKAYSSTSTSPIWNANADINNDFIVSTLDLDILSNNYGTVDP